MHALLLPVTCHQQSEPLLVKIRIPAPGYELSAIDHRYVVTQLPYLIKVRGNQEDCFAGSFHFEKFFVDVFYRADIDAAGRLCGNDYVGVLG